jgi:hypothetical protein
MFGLHLDPPSPGTAPIKRGWFLVVFPPFKSQVISKKPLGTTSAELLIEETQFAVAADTYLVL